MSVTQLSKTSGGYTHSWENTGNELASSDGEGKVHNHCTSSTAGQRQREIVYKNKTLPFRWFTHPTDNKIEGLHASFFKSLGHRFGTLFVRGTFKQPIEEVVKGHTLVLLGSVLQDCKGKPEGTSYRNENALC